MIVLLSPAKSLDYESPLPTRRATKPRFMEDSAELVAQLRKLSVDQLGQLMSISPKLAQLNHDRFVAWEGEATRENARPALFAFTGDVYQGMELEKWRAGDLDLAQKRLRILSGLYGVLRPLDLMQPYRLEMGTRLANDRGRNLYDFWGEILTRSLNADLAKSGSGVVLNLASQEYFSAVREDALKGRLVTPVFKDEKNGKFKIISFFAKKARGMMADFVIRNGLTDPADLKGFTSGGYRFSRGDSDDSVFVFLRQEKVVT